MRIANFVAGWLGTYDRNETEHVSSERDPCKVRVAVDADKVESNLGAFSVNLRRPDGRHEEYGYIMGRLTADRQEGAFYIACRPRNSQHSHQKFYIDPNVAIFGVPLVADLASEDGRFRLIVQNDGNLVLYEGDSPLWASNTVRSSWLSRLAFWR